MSIQVNNSTSSAACTQPAPVASSPHAPSTADIALQRAQAQRAADAEFDAEVRDALQKTSIKADIEYKANGHLVLRYVDEQTRQIEFQIPTETVLSLIDSLSQASRNRAAVTPGAFVDQQA